jgi:hypothetical protein
MAFITDPNYIIEKMVADKLPYYQVIDTDGRTVIDENENPEVDVHQASKRLMDLFERISGTFSIVLSSKTKQEKGAGGPQRNLRLTTKIGNSYNNNSVNGIGAVSNTPKIEDIEARLEAKYKEQFDAKMREIELLRRIEKLEEEKNAPDDIEKYAPIIQAIAGIFGGGAVPLNGSPNINGPGDVNPVFSRINAAVKILYSNDKNFVENLEKLAQIAQNKPFIYSMAISKLKEY